MYESENLKINKDLEGMSLKSIGEHFKLYQGYVKKANEIQGALKTADKVSANGVYSQYGELRRQETFAVNGMKLHEVYFGQLDGDGAPRGVVAGMIEKDFGSVDAWKEEMVATGMSSRGWAILAYDLKDNRLHVYGADAQNVGAVWAAIPLVALDVYEHAYFMDHGTNRKAYVDAFFKNLNWEFVDELAGKFGIGKI
jgi:Fe-Mn family superoxide dismutase